MPKLRNTLTTLAILLVVAALVAGVVKLRQQRSAEVAALPPPEPAPWALHAARVRRGDLSRGFPVLATLSANTEITVSSQVAGTIQAMGPREGVTVEQGEFLARIDVRELREQQAGIQAQLQGAKADVARTRDEYRRQQELVKKKLTSRELLEAKRTAALVAKQKVADLERQIAALQVRIGYGEVLAPRDAVIAARLAEPGDIAQPGKALYRLTVDSSARLRVMLPQRVLEQVHPGTPVVLEYGGKQHVLHLSRVFPALDANALGAAEADLEHMPFGLPSGARLPARVILEQAKGVLVVPHRAVVRTVDGGFLFKLAPHGRGLRLQRVPVEIELDAHEGLAVNANIQAGDRVVVAHSSVLLRLHDGDPVIVEATPGSPTPAPPDGHEGPIPPVLRNTADGTAKEANPERQARAEPGLARPAP